MKQCIKCGSITFSPRGDCVDCARLRSARYRANNPYKARLAVARCWDKNRTAYVVTQKLWTKNNREKSNEIKNRYEQSNPDKAKQIHANYKMNNKPAVNAATARRYASKTRSTPAWANDFFIKEIYALAALRTKMLGVNWEVDHIVPLRGADVCGFHCEVNMRVIPAITNRKKGNTLLPNVHVAPILFD